MTISGDYATPVLVNGFVCKNCTDVDEAKKHINPAHPQDGPYGVDAAHDPGHAAAVQFGGSLLAPPYSPTPVSPTAPGGRADVSV